MPKNQKGIITKIFIALIVLAVIALFVVLILPVNRFVKMETSRKGLSAGQVAEILQEINHDIKVDLSPDYLLAIEQCALREGEARLEFNMEAGRLEIICAFTDGGTCSQHEFVEQICQKEYTADPEPHALVKLGNKEIRVFKLNEDDSSARYEYVEDGEITETKTDEFTGSLSTDSFFE